MVKGVKKGIVFLSTLILKGVKLKYFLSIWKDQ